MKPPSPRVITSSTQTEGNYVPTVGMECLELNRCSSIYHLPLVAQGREGGRYVSHMLHHSFPLLFFTLGKSLRGEESFSPLITR